MDRSNFARALRHNHQDVENYNYSWYAYHLSPVTSNVNFQEGFQEGFQVDVPRWFSLIFNLLSFIKLPNDQGCKYLLVTVHVSRAFLIQYNFVTLDTRSSKVERFLSVKKKEKKREISMDLVHQEGIKMSCFVIPWHHALLPLFQLIWLQNITTW